MVVQNKNRPMELAGNESVEPVLPVSGRKDMFNGIHERANRNEMIPSISIPLAAGACTCGDVDWTSLSVSRNPKD